MTELKVATFNVKNLIGADQEYYEFERYTPEEYAWKRDWLARQLLKLDADVVCFQEIFDEEALWDVISETNRRGEALNRVVLPGEDKKYKKRAIFRRLGFTPYKRNQLRFVPNVNDGKPGQRRPGLAILSRFGFRGKVTSTQVLDEPLKVDFPGLGGGKAGHFKLTKTSRPILRAVVPVEGQSITIYNIHFKSKLGEFVRAPDADYPAEADLTRYDPLGRAVGEMRAAVRRMAEASVLRGLILADLKKGRPVIAMGDFNDSEHSVVSAIVSGETPFKNYSWIRKHDAKHRDDRYSSKENEKIQREISRVKMTSAEHYFVRKSAKDMVYSSAFGGVYESIDQILFSPHFDPENDRQIAQIDYLSVFNDHLTDGSHPEAPYNKLASDHGQLVAHIAMRDTDGPEAKSGR